jgi:hypothetical protein
MRERAAAASAGSEVEGNLEPYQMLFGISDLRWSCSVVELRGSADLELFFESWSYAKQALYIGCVEMNYIFNGLDYANRKLGT